MKLYHGLQTEFKEFRLEKRFPYITGMWFTDTQDNDIMDFYKSRSEGKILEVEADFKKPILDLSMYDTDDRINEREAEDFLRDCEEFNMDYVDDIISSVFVRFDVKLYNILLQMFMFSEDSFNDMARKFSAFTIKENGVLTYFVFNPSVEILSHRTLNENYSLFKSTIYEISRPI